MKRKIRRFTGTVEYIPIDEIEKSTIQPRKYFDDAALRELADSIAACGILNPLTLRRKGTAYELVAGERRLRAAKMAGLYEVPCILLNADLETASLLALVENIQREDLDFLEEARGIQKLMQLFGLSQETVAQRLGKSQPAIANKLRILKLPADLLDALRDAHCSERHARALLRLDSPDLQRSALENVVKRQLNVAQTDAYIERLCQKGAPPRKAEPVYRIRDVRLFLNTVKKSLAVMQSAGVNARFGREETDSEITLTIHIPK